MKKVKYMLALLIPLLIASCNAGKEKAVPETPKKIVVNMDSLLEDCRLNTIEIAKADSELCYGGYYHLIGDSIPLTPYEERKGFVQACCEDAEEIFLTEEDIYELDSMLLAGAVGLLVRDADRSLDTIVNHQRFVFTIIP